MPSRVDVSTKQTVCQMPYRRCPGSGDKRPGNHAAVAGRQETKQRETLLQQRARGTAPVDGAQFWRAKTPSNAQILRTNGVGIGTKRNGTGHK